MKNIMLLFFLGISIVSNAQSSYTLSADSKLTIDGTSTVHSWTVTANTLMGDLTVKDEVLNVINFEVAVSDIMSERGPTMDNKMHAALKKETHPKVVFVLEQVKNDSVLVGHLTIAGTKKNVEISTISNFNEDNIKIIGEEKIVLQDFEIEPPTAMFGQIIVGDEVTVNFDLVFIKE